MRGLLCGLARATGAAQSVVLHVINSVGLQKIKRSARGKGDENNDACHHEALALFRCGFHGVFNNVLPPQVNSRLVSTDSSV